MTGYLSVTILSALKLMDRDAVSVQALYMAATGIVLFIAYTMLINIFWTYVINMNKELDKKAKMQIESEAMENQQETTENIYKLWQDTETLDGDAEN